MKAVGFALIIMFTVFCIGRGAEADQKDIARFYNGNTLRFIVGWSPGGGYDTYARLLAATLQKNLDCTVIVQNMPGAGGLIAMNFMYNTAKKNGLYLSITPVGLPLTQALGAASVKFDCAKFSWLVSLVRDTHFIGVSPDSPYKTLDDLTKPKKILAATTDVTSPLGQPLIMAAEAVGMNNLRIVPGYRGTTQCILAVKRGEVQFTAGSLHHFDQKNALLRPIVAISMERNPDLPDVPALPEFHIKKDSKRMLEMLFNARATGRGVITTPGTSKEKIEFLRNAIMKSLQDPELLKRAKKLNLPIEPIAGEKVQAIAAEAVKLSPQELKELKFVFFKKYL